MANKKYFIAVQLPDPILGKVEEIKQELFHKYNLKGALRCSAHITLHRPFEWKDEKEVALIEQLGKFKFEPVFKIVLNNFGFFAPRVIYVDVVENEALNKLHDSLKRFAKRELNLFNEYDDLRAFKPHVTIASRDLRKNLFYELEQKYLQNKFSYKFDCKQITLFKLNKTWENLCDFDI